LCTVQFVQFNNYLYQGRNSLATIDLHIHSNHSNDADFSPEQLVDRCLKAGLSHAAIADHNSVRAIDAAVAAARGTSLTIISAIEMDCVLDGIVLHILGYGIENSDPIFSEIEEDLHQQEQANSARLVQLVRQLGIEFDDAVLEALSYDGVITGEMIAEAALSFDAEDRNKLLDPYRGEGERSDNPYVNFYWDYCSQGKPAYTPMNFISLSRAIEIIKTNNGVPILAHPGINVKEDGVFLERILSAGVMGIEVYSSYHNKEQVKFYREAALSKQLLITCGSDFHGKNKKSIEIGSTDCEGQEAEIIARLTGMIDKLHQQL
jgi:predicted metal-dependent phosphoesterase TrpH